MTPEPDTFPSHRALVSKETDEVMAVMNCFGGRVWRVFPVRYAIGKTLKTGSISNDNTTISVNQKYWIVVGYSTWQEASAMKNKCKATISCRRLASGVWHEVISE